MSTVQIRECIRDLSKQNKLNRDLVKQLQKAGKPYEASPIQSNLVTDRLKLRAAYLAYGTLNGTSLKAIERKALNTRPEGEYQLKYLSSQYWEFLEAAGYTTLQKGTAIQMLRTHLGR